MIDWLDFTVELTHKPIPTGEYMLTNHEGEIVRHTPLHRQVESSYSSTIGVSSIVQDAESYCKVPSGYATHLKFRGNPTKFLQGHNVFGIDCIKTLTTSLVKAVLPKLDFTAFDISRCVKTLKQMRFQVTRIDITKMFMLGDNSAVDDYLYMLPHTVTSRGDRCGFSHNTFYVGKHSTIWTLKFYNKFKELCSRSKSHRLPDQLYNSGIKEWAEGQLRVELTLRKKQLDLLNITDAKTLQKQLNTLFAEFAGRITMTNQHIKARNLDKLSARGYDIYHAWKRGENMKTYFTSKTRFYHWRKLFLEHGINIAKPPIDNEFKRATIEPITRHLTPREITTADLPKNLRQYLLAA